MSEHTPPQLGPLIKAEVIADVLMVTDGTSVVGIPLHVAVAAPKLLKVLEALCDIDLCEVNHPPNTSCGGIWDQIDEAIDEARGKEMTMLPHENPRTLAEVLENIDWARAMLEGPPVPLNRWMAALCLADQGPRLVAYATLEITRP